MYHTAPWIQCRFLQASLEHTHTHTYIAICDTFPRNTYNKLLKYVGNMMHIRAIPRVLLLVFLSLIPLFFRILWSFQCAMPGSQINNLVPFFFGCISNAYQISSSRAGNLNQNCSFQFQHTFDSLSGCRI